MPVLVHLHKLHRPIGPVAFSASSRNPGLPHTCYQQRSAMIERSTPNPATVRSPLLFSLVRPPLAASTLCLHCQILGPFLSLSPLSTTKPLQRLLQLTGSTRACSVSWSILSFLHFFSSFITFRLSQPVPKVLFHFFQGVCLSSPRVALQP